jgi:hypothetical protein
MRLLAIVPLLTACSGGCSSQAPPEFDRFRTDLGGNQVIRLTVQWPSPTSPANIPVELELGPEGASAAASQGRVTTDGNTVRFGDGDIMIPLVDVADQAADLYSELRSGLSDSAWTPIDAPRLGPLNVAADASWAELELPFDWARSERVQLAVDRDSGHLRYIIINTDDPPLTVSARPPRGGARTVTLTEGTQLGLAVSAYTVGKP